MQDLLKKNVLCFPKIGQLDFTTSVTASTG